MIEPFPLVNAQDNSRDSLSHSIIAEEDGIKQTVEISGARFDTEVIIYQGNKDNVIGSFLPGNSGKVSLSVGYESGNLPPGENYIARQESQGVDGEDTIILLSDSFNVNPNKVKLEVAQHSGKDGKSGVISVSNTTAGNTLKVYKMENNNESLYGEYRATGSSHNIRDLPYGVYLVSQVDNKSGLESGISKDVTINYEMDPVISFKKDLQNTYDMDTPQWPGITISEDDISIENSSGNIEYFITVDGNESQRDIREPGVYTVTYSITDEIGQSNELKRVVTVRPPTLKIEDVVHTCLDVDSNGTCNDSEELWRKTGDVYVDNAMDGAELNVFQDPNKTPITGATSNAHDSKEGLFIISNIPIGSQFYVTQTINGVESSSSSRFSIRDNTNPIIELINGSEVTFIRGEPYIEYGAEARDNVDDPNELTAKIVIDSSDVNMDVPGKYTVTYNVTDNAGNRADQVERTVIVKPHAVTAIGSDADVGEVGVKNAFPGAVLKLYNVNNTDQPVAVSRPLPANATTYVFKHETDENGNIKNPDRKLPPGSYYVVQEFTVSNSDEPLESMRSNIVDIRDTDRPYITIKGSENLFFTWNQTEDEYSYNGSFGSFEDPGAFAEDYLDDDDELTKNIKRKVFYNGKEICSDTDDTLPNCTDSVKIEFPGVYEIAYNVTANRGTKADEKRRTITVAPPAVDTIEAHNGESRITVSGTFFNENIETMVHLYNRYDELITSDLSTATGDLAFEEIPAGLGYYVTQTVNNVASAPSDPVNLSLFEEADELALMNSFSIAYEGNKQAVGTIDHEEGEIHVTLPKAVDLKGLTAVFKATGKVTVNNEEQISGSSTQDFNKPVRYTVTPEKGEARTYTVIVTQETFEAEAWTDTLSKRVSFTATGQTTTLAPSEIREAQKVGVSFIGDDRAVHVPAANVKEASYPSVTLKKDAFTARAGDPSWARNAEFATEIRFGNEAFMNPIEFEIEHKEDKQLARIVRDGNKVYAIAQPTQRQGTQLIGLVTTSGVYAFIDEVTPPTIDEVAKGEYRLSANANSTIYYTTSSRTVDFEKSARNASLSSYMLDETVLNDEAWETYRPGQTIQSNKEIYAYTMQNSIISPVEGHIQTKKRAWGNTVTRPVSHSFTVTFNAPADKKILYNDLIYVIDDATGKKVPVKLQLSNDRKQVIISPQSAYKRNKQYTLHIEQRVKGHTKNNEFLQQALTQTFIAK